MRPATPVHVLLAALVALSLLAACTGDEDPSAEPAPAIDEVDEDDPSPDEDEDDEDADADDAADEDADDEDADEDEDADDDEVDAAGIAGTEPVELEGADPQDPAVLAEVRTGSHEGHERVVWEFSEGDAPRVEVAYVDADQVTEPGSGERLEVEGDAFLLVRAEFAADLGAELFAQAEPYDGPQRLEADALASVAEVARLGDFEGNLQWVIGLDEERPFDAEMLTDPLRLVVDVAVE